MNDNNSTPTCGDENGMAHIKYLAQNIRYYHHFIFFSVDQNFTSDSDLIFEVTVWFQLNF